MRVCNYVSDAEKKRTNWPLWKHIMEKHHDVMAIPIYSHFKMELVQTTVLHKTTEKEGR